MNARGQVIGNGQGAFLWTDGTTLTLPGLGGNWIEARAINNSGQVVGFATTGGEFSRRHAVLWQDGNPLDLGTIGTRESYATSINDAGTVVGELVISNRGRQAFVWDKGTMINVGASIGALDSRIRGINSRGQVLISARFDSTSSNLIWTNGDLIDLAEFSPIAINDRGQLLGPSSLWDDGIETQIGTLGGTIIAHALNDRGQVAGTVLLPSGQHHAFFWSKEGGTIDLGALNGDSQSEGLSINNRGEVVGTSTGDQIHAFLWRAGEMIDLGILPGGIFAKAALINERGEIGGFSNSPTGGCAVLWRVRH